MEGEEIIAEQDANKEEDIGTSSSIKKEAILNPAEDTIVIVDRELVPQDQNILKEDDIANSSDEDDPMPKK